MLWADWCGIKCDIQVLGRLYTAVTSFVMNYRVTMAVSFEGLEEYHNLLITLLEMTTHVSEFRGQRMLKTFPWCRQDFTRIDVPHREQLAGV